MSSDINTSSIIAHIKSGDIRKKLLDKVELESVSERRSHNKASDVIPAARVSQLNRPDDEKYDSEHNNKKKKKKRNLGKVNSFTCYVSIRGRLKYRLYFRSYSETPSLLLIRR